MDLSKVLAAGIPGIPSDYIPHDPTPKQTAYLFLPHREAFYGGAAGGGKASLLVTPSNAAKMGYTTDSQFQEFRMKFASYVMTPFGEKLLDDIQVGDAVLNPDGTTCHVIAVHPDREQVCYRVTTIDGASVVVGEDHLWSIKTSGQRTRRKVADPYTGNKDDSSQQKFNMELLRRYRTVTTKSLAALHQKAESQSQSGTRPYWVSIPLTEPVNFQLPPGRTKMLPGYTLGVWLGDGSISGSTPRWFKPDKALAEFITTDLKSNGNTDTITTLSKEGAYSFVGGDTFACLRSLSLEKCRAWEKFIPKQYLHGPIPLRTALLQGLMDTDGTSDGRGQCYFCSTSEQLIKDVQYLARSLGYSATSTPKPEPAYVYNGEKKIGRPAWNLYITGRNRENLFRLSRKKKRVTELNNEGGKQIISVEKLPKKLSTRCITVSHPNGLYITNDFIVTHNSDALLMAALQYVNVPGYSAIVFRKTLSDLKLPGSLLDRAHSWLNGTPAKWMGSEHAYYFPTYDHAGNLCEPAKLVFGYIGQEGAKYRYQGAEFNFVAFDELTQHSEEDYTYLFSRLRRVKCVLHTEKDKKGNPIYHPQCPTCQSAARVPLRIRAASNPGGIGHLWVKERFAIQADILPSGKTRFIGRNPNRPYIPAFLIDNPHLDQEGYDSGLEELDPVTREQLRNGNWDISPDSRFKPHWFRRYSIRNQKFHLSPNGTGDGCYLHEFQRVFITADTAASTKEGPGDDKRYRLPNGGSWTVLAVWALTHDYNLLLLDIRRFRKEIPEIPKEVKALYRKWKPQEIVMEAIGTGKGAYQLCVKEGLPMRAIHPHNDKIVRSTDAQVRAEKGKIWLPCNPGPLWLKEYENELFTWSGHPYEVDDQVDVTSFAAQAISWEAAGGELGEADNQNVVVAQEGPSVVYAYGNFAGGIWY